MTRTNYPSDLQEEIDKLDKLEKEAIKIARTNSDDSIAMLKHIETERAKIDNVYNKCSICQYYLNK
jgi:hypothetical protein